MASPVASSGTANPRSQPRADLLARLAAAIAGLSRPHPLRVAIDGVDAAGKTTLADELVAPLEALGRTVVRASIDSFHRPAAARYRRGRLSPEGYYRDSFEVEAIVDVLLRPLGLNGSRLIRRRVFDFEADAPVHAPIERVPDEAVLLFDGVFLLAEPLASEWDYSVFVRASFAVTLERAIRRDRERFGGVDEVRRRYADRYIPGQVLYLSECQPAARASVVVDNDDPASPTLGRGLQDASRTGPARVPR